MDLDGTIKTIQGCKRYVKVKAQINIAKTKLNKSRANIMTRKSLRQLIKISVTKTKHKSGLNVPIIKIE